MPVTYPVGPNPPLLGQPSPALDALRLAGTTTGGSGMRPNPNRLTETHIPDVTGKTGIVKKQAPRLTPVEMAIQSLKGAFPPTQPKLEQ